MKKKIAKKKLKLGRPSKYRPEMADALVRFFDIEPHYPKDMTITKSDGTQIDRTVEEPADLPFFSNFCASLGITQETMLQWTEKYPNFSEAYQRAKELQKQILVINGLRGLYSPAFAIFTAKNILGWRDTQHLDAKTLVAHLHFTNIQVKDLDTKSPEDLIECFRKTISKND